MKENFIDTLTINSRMYVFRFIKDGKESRYIVSLINNKSIPPFTMSHDGDGWKVDGDAKPVIKAAEKLLSEVIVKNN
jgi:hypothetical protein